MGNQSGRIVAHCSEEGGDADVGLELHLPGGRQLWVGEISRCLWNEAGADVEHLGADTGWWIVMFEPGEAAVIGKVASMEAAEALLTPLSMAIRGADTNDQP